MTTQTFAEHPDEIAAALIKAGLARNTLLLDMNGCLSSPAQLERPWSLPSRLMNFPVVVGSPSFAMDGTPVERTVSVMHPLLVDHPFVLEVSRILGFEIAYETGDKVAYRHKMATWYHAVDLVSAGMLAELLETRRFTTDDDLAGALDYGLRYGGESKNGRRQGHVTIGEARQVMDLLGYSDPGPHLPALEALIAAEASNAAINFSFATSSADRVWSLIHGIERGLLDYRHGYLKMSGRKGDSQLLLI